MLSNIEPGSEGTSSTATTAATTAATTTVKQANADPSTREAVQVMVVGSAPGIDSVIKKLYRLGFADVDDWSKPQRYPNSDRSMSIVTKMRQL